MAIDTEQLYKLVTELRSAQKEFFKLQKMRVERKPVLEKCKQLEDRLDKMLEAEKRERLAIQTELFR